MQQILDEQNPLAGQAQQTQPQMQSNQPQSAPPQNNQNTQSEQAAQYPIASIFERVIAFVIDCLFFYTIFFWTYYFILISRDSFSDLDNFNAFYVLTFACLFFIYSAVFNSGKRQSLGKWLLGIRTVSRRGGNLSLAKGFLRAFGYFLNFITLLCGFALALFNKKRLTLED
jgi:uncharacterized RDD family membrane protein YckC